MDNEKVYQLTFKYIHELEQKATVLRKAYDLDQAITKHQLIANDIKFSEIMDGVLLLDFAQPDSNPDKTNEILNDHSIFEACLIRMGVKTIDDESNP